MVWRLLIDAENWSSYFPAEDQVKVLTGEPELVLGTKYSRVTVGSPMSLVVTECEPFRRLAWATTVDGDETGSSAYHGWVITPTANGCHVLTEETQQGPWFIEELGRKHPGALYSYYQEWIESLTRAAEVKVAKRLVSAFVVKPGSHGPGFTALSRRGRLASSLVQRIDRA